jgi:F-type H+-transporting ATPase subunit alpha
MLAEALRSQFSLNVTDEGTVMQAGDGVARLSGPAGVALSELVEFEGGQTGIAFDLGRRDVGVVVLDDAEGVRAGHRAFTTGRIASVAAGPWVLGRAIDPLGRPLDGEPRPASGVVDCPVDADAPRLAVRAFVDEPLLTGVKVIDAMLPIGRGQRELIVGDQAIGKTSIAMDAIINQKQTGVICVYAAIGQKKSSVLKVMDVVRERGAAERTVFVVAEAGDSLGLQYIAPYAAMSVAEYFMHRGHDVLIVFDDLTRHAEAYRSLSLLIRRPPGREAFPGDIFFVHSRLLERAAKLGDAHGGGSITALPIVETLEGRISSYIPTNLISITDGQIFLDAALFHRGVRPAVDVGRSVSRIGARAQCSAMRQVAGRLKIDYSRFLELEVFTRFGSHLDAQTERALQRGALLRELLKQPRFAPVPMERQVLGFAALEAGALDGVGPEGLREGLDELMDSVYQAFPGTVAGIADEGCLLETDLEEIKQWCRDHAPGL